MVYLQTMASIYNILGGNGTARYSTLVAMIKYAASAGKAELAMVSPAAAALDGMVAEWGCDVAKTRELYSTIFEAASKHGNAGDAHAFRLKYLQTFQGQKATPEALTQASIAVGEVVGNPDVLQFDEYMDLDAIKALKDDSTHALVYAVLDLFSKDELKVSLSLSLSCLHLVCQSCISRARL